MPFTRRHLAALSAAFLPCPRPAAAQGWPQQQVRLVVPYPPGAITDALGRLVALGLNGEGAQRAIVENRVGAGGNVGSGFVAQSAPDGTTLLVTAAGPISINPFVFRSMPYVPERDLAGVTVLAQVPSALVVTPGLPVRSVAELIEYARANPGRLNGSSGGISSTSHLSLELFKTLAKVEVLHVPFSGAAPARTELLAGRVHLTISDLSTYIADIRSGAVRLLATGSPRRMRAFPDVPTLDEAGVAGYASTSWFALAAPSRTPPDLLAAMNATMVGLLRRPDIAQRVEALGAEVGATSLAETQAFFSSESEKWRRIIELARIQAE